MIRSAIDTNVISALWSAPRQDNDAQVLLTAARIAGPLVICGPVYAELMAFPGTKPGFIDQFLASTGISLDLDLNIAIWRSAGESFARYSRRRVRTQGGIPRRLPADFMIGAHALARADRLLTFNGDDYRASFPNLTVTWKLQS